MVITESDITEANKVFHQPPSFANCAQSVAIMSGREDLAGELAACGGGRAPGGLCGALHATLLLAPAEKREEIIDEFKKYAGATTCREIKSSMSTPCDMCVAIGRKLVSAYD